jgi:S-DNA-T family DNA segregation ATPase FtsK/SpoIIIE
MAARRADSAEATHTLTGRFDSTAFVLLGVGILLAIAFVSADAGSLAGDWTLIGQQTENWLGVAGSWLAQSLAESLGAAAYVFVAAWLVLSLDLFLRPHWWAWLRRLSGWLILTPACAVVAERLGPNWLSAQCTYGGGTLGAALSTLLNDVSSEWIRAVILSGASVIGIALATDRALLWLSRRVGDVIRFFGGRISAAGAWLIRLRPGRLLSVPLRSPRPKVRTVQRPVPSRPAVPPPAPAGEYALPSIDLLDEPIPLRIADFEQQLRDRAALLETTFADFGLNIRVVGINTGPVITQYEVAL